MPTYPPFGKRTPAEPRVIVELKKTGRLNAVYATSDIEVSVLRLIDDRHHRDGDPTRARQLEHNLKFMKKIYPLPKGDPHLK